MGVGIDLMKTLLLLTLVLVVLGLFLEMRKMSSSEQSSHTVCECMRRSAEDGLMLGSAHTNTAAVRPSSQHSSRSKGIRRYLSYQPPGNGWNNQRIALENALVLAKLLNRTLVVHPLAPHELGNKMKIGKMHGYMVYNMLNSSDLLPLSLFMDLDLMSKVVPVEEVTVSHPQFVTDYSHLTWKNICHSPGFGFWVDQLPQTAAEVDLLAKQKFSSLGRVWKERCVEEKRRAGRMPSAPLIKYVSDLQEDKSEMLYFECGTLFGMQIRFTTVERALEAQTWTVDHVRYNQAIWSRVAQVGQIIGPHFNAIQVRRRNHMDSKLPTSFWMERMVEKSFSKNLSVYVATNDPNKEWFRPFVAEGYKLYFSVDLSQYLSFPSVQESLRNDLLAIHEQCLCELADTFVGSPASTFTALIVRHRGEVRRRGPLMMETLHTYWIGHQIK